MCETREKLFKFIVAYKVEHDGNSPTYREMMAATGLTTTSMVAYHLEKMELAGLIERPQQVGNSRVIEVVGGEWKYDRRPVPLRAQATGDGGEEGQARRPAPTGASSLKRGVNRG